MLSEAMRQTDHYIGKQVEQQIERERDGQSVGHTVRPSDTKTDKQEK